MPFPIPVLKHYDMVTSSWLNTYLRDNLNFLFNNDLTLFGLSPVQTPPSGLNGTLKAYTFRIKPRGIREGTFYKLAAMQLEAPVIAFVRHGGKVQRFMFMTRTGATATPQVVPPEYTVGEEPGAAAMAVVYESTSSVWVGLFMKPSDPIALSGEYEVVLITDQTKVLSAVDEPAPVDVPFGVQKFSWGQGQDIAYFGHTTSAATPGSKQLSIELRDWNMTDNEGEFGFARLDGYVIGTANGDLYMSWTSDPRGDQLWRVRALVADGTVVSQTSSGSSANPAIISRVQQNMPTFFRVFLWKFGFDVSTIVTSTYLTSSNPSLFLSSGWQALRQNAAYDTIYFTPSNGFFVEGAVTAFCTNW
jgi:hypothetical protein